jgi:hypothetical protein
MNIETPKDAATALLNETIAAHDPEGKWDGYRSFTARMTVAGSLWGFKHVGGLFENIQLTGRIGEEYDTIAPFTAPDRVGVFTPERTTIETIDGAVVEQRDDPLTTFAGQTRLSPWDPMQALYFASYANWNYLVAPFVYRSPGFFIRATGDWNENGQTWRRLEVTYPDGFATHSRVQTIYLDASGLIARLDYSVDILGGGPAAHYPSRYKSFDGILVPTKREVYVRNPDDTPILDNISIDIDVHTIAFS